MVSAGIELVFFVQAHTMLCFGFLMRTGVITHGCFSCSAKHFAASRAAWPARGHRELGGDVAGTAGPGCPEFFLPCAAFAVPNKLCFPPPLSSGSCIFQILSPIPPRESEQAAGWCSAPCQGETATSWHQIPQSI